MRAGSSTSPTPRSWCYEYASTFVGRLRYQPRSWPKWFKPSLYNLDPEPYGPFPESLVLTDRGDVTLVPIPGHSIAQVAVVIRRNKHALFFGGDHMLRQDWFVEDLAAGRMVMLGRFFPKLAVETSKRIKQFVQEVPTVLVPSHDSEVAARISAGETLKL